MATRIQADLCSNGLDLLIRVRDARLKSPPRAVWLRGLTNEAYDLFPRIGRQHTFAGQSTGFNDKIERRMLHRFRRYAFEFLGRALTEWEALFIARHHGLPVRLLDWTSNPLAALYFACEVVAYNDVPNGKIWFLISNGRSDDRVDVFRPDSSPFDVKGIRLVYPMVVAPRINAQSRLFTIQDGIHGDPWINSTRRITMKAIWTFFV